MYSTRSIKRAEYPISLSYHETSLKNLSFGKKDRFNHDDIGWNYRMTNIQASLGVSQLKRINQIVRTKHKIGLEYYKRLKNNPNLYIPKIRTKYAKKI